jgi:FAD/FMN-containing dehydrogenase
MDGAWRNWSGSVVFRPREIARPRHTEALALLVAESAARGEPVRVVGAGHSSNEILASEGRLVSLEHFRTVHAVDREGCEATVGAGAVLEELGRTLYEHDLALPNYGDVATQTIGGAISTGTHGTGPTQPNLSQMLLRVTLVDGQGRVRRIERDDLDRLRAARVALGTLGAFTTLTLKLVPAFDVERREYATGTEAALAQLDALNAGNRSFDFYWYPRRDDVKLRLVNPIGGGTVPADARPLTRGEGYSHEVIPTHSGIPHHFEESEYALPAENGPACFRAIRSRVLQHWRHVVGWRVLYRTVAADDADLSPAHGRATATISLHQNSTLPWRAFFEDIEPIFLDHGGRPHWAKKHTRRGAQLAALYPRWAHFHRVRAEFDPDGTFLTPHMRELLDVAA